MTIEIDLWPMLAIWASAAFIVFVWSFDWRAFYIELERLKNEDE